MLTGLVILVCLVTVQHGRKKKVKLGSKDKGNPITGHEGPDRGGWSAPRPGRFFPVKDPVPIV